MPRQPPRHRERLHAAKRPLPVVAEQQRRQTAALADIATALERIESHLASIAKSLAVGIQATADENNEKLVTVLERLSQRIGVALEQVAAAADRSDE